MALNYPVIIKEIERALDQGIIPMPSFPENLMKIREALNNPNVSIKQLAQLVHTDAVLANRVFAIAKSAAFNMQTDNMSLLHIMQKLGLNMIRTAIYNHCLSQLFADRRFKRIEASSQFVRNRSLEIAGISYALSKNFKVGDPSVALMAGLFHNIGALIILSWLARFPAKIQEAKDQKALIVYAQQYFSKKIMEFWRVPEYLKRVVESGEETTNDNQNNLKYLHLVNLSRYMSAVFRNSTNADKQFSEASANQLNISKSKLNDEKENLMKQMIMIIQSIR